MKNSLIPILALLAAIPVTGIGQTALTTPDPLDVMGKLQYHFKGAFGPMAIAGDAAYAGILQAANAPLEWEQGGAAYGKRVASMVALSGIHGALAFGLDSTLHQDPRYFRSSGTGFWRRSGHALRGTLLTRTDSGGENCVHVAHRQRLRLSRSFQPLVSGPAQYGAPRVYPGFGNTRIGSGRQSGKGVLARY
jgi:hypothetical protein